MPIYEYACKKCQHTLDALQKMSDAPLLECPECGEAELRRLISAPRFRLKGQGWYETDFKKDKQRNLVSSDGDAPREKSTEDKSTDKTDKKEAGSKESGSKDSGNKESGSKESTRTAETPKPARDTKKDTKAPAD